MDSPLPNFSRIRSTVTRVPATTGFPIITLGSDTIMGSLIVILLAMTLADSPHPQRITQMVERSTSAVQRSASAGGQMFDAGTSFSLVPGSMLLPVRSVVFSHHCRNIAERDSPHAFLLAAPHPIPSI